MHPYICSCNSVNGTSRTVLTLRLNSMGGTKIQPVSRVAVIGAGPAGYAAVRALVLENKFNKIRVFERRDRVGGIWYSSPSMLEL